MIKKIKNLYINLSHPQYDTLFLLTLLLLSTTLAILIVHYVPYTEIDWIAYNEEVETYLAGERNYLSIRGHTGPLVYPAGFLYLYATLRRWCGGDGSDVRMAQYIFVGFYVLTTMVALVIYRMVLRRLRRRGRVQEKTTTTTTTTTTTVSSDELSSAHLVWSWRCAMVLLCGSKRINSIFMLRLFNDGPTMLLVYLSIILFMRSYYHMGSVVFSLAVSIKMNALLFAPGLLLIFLQMAKGWVETVRCLTICAVVQVVMGWPFLTSFPVEYLRKAFEFDRVFFYKWTVNGKFWGEELFVSKRLSLVLLLCHLGALGLLARKWMREVKGPGGRMLFLSKERRVRLNPTYVAYTLFVSNFVGIVFARTLHYQFYVWYFHTIPFMLWMTSIPWVMRLVIVGGIEWAFNVFPATALSSAVLQLCHLLVLAFVYWGEVPRILEDKDKVAPAKDD